MLRSRQWITVLGLLVLVGLAIAGVLLSGNSSRSSVTPQAGAAANQPMVDMRSLETARKLLPLATTPDEQRLAQDALRLADHEVDLAFANALRDAAEAPVQLPTELQKLHDRMEQAEAKFEAAQARVAMLTRQVETASNKEKEAATTQMQLAKAELELDQDELDDAKEDLIRAGGNPEGKLQQLLNEHEAMHGDDSKRPSANPVTRADASSRNSLELAESWLALRSLRIQLEQAINESRAIAGELNRDHDALEKRIAEQASRREATKTVAAGLAQEAPSQHDATSKMVAAAALASLKHFTNDQKKVATFDKRIQNQRELSDVYANWAAMVQARSRATLNGMVRSVLWVLIIFLLVYLAGLLMDRLFVDITPDKKRLITLRSVLRFAIQLLGVLCAIFVLFGVPSQTPTIIGLTAAGLSVALKDFIVGFIGWFVLMGKNGLRIGDWVEINGVFGEVVEIGLFRTVLLETGNWADSGHPTGRKVAFVNSFAVEGHFFNFSTAGQWLWDEVQIMIPSGRDPHAVIEAIQKIVVAETEGDARLAEQEWHRASSRYRVQFTAEPAINVRPTPSGIEVHVRYITRAHERYAMRTRLYEKMVDVLHGAETPATSSS